MMLADDVTFESLAAVQEELSAWLGPRRSTEHVGENQAAQRDALVSVLIHHLAQELSDIRVRSQIQALLSDLA